MDEIASRSRFLRRLVGMTVFCAFLTIYCGDDGSEWKFPASTSAPVAVETPYASASFCGHSETERTHAYRFVQRECDTDVHRFLTHGDYCDALRRQRLNHRCALADRYYCFIETCPGGIWELIDEDPPA